MSVFLSEWKVFIYLLYLIEGTSNVLWQDNVDGEHGGDFEFV